MNRLLKLEELAMLCVGLWVYQQTGESWWWFAGLFFTPDLGMVGYLVNEKIGAWIYNLFHHKALALAILGLGWYLQNPILEIAGIILFSHSTFDRMMGYGLKYEKGFKFTHLGEIGPTKS